MEVIQDSQHNFTKDKSCLTSQAAFCDGGTRSGGEEGIKMTFSHLLVIYLDLCKALYWFPKTSFSLNWREKFDGWTVQWRRLNGCIQRAMDQALSGNQ